MSAVRVLTRCSPLVLAAALAGAGDLVPGMAVALGIGDFVVVSYVGSAGLPSSDAPCGAPFGRRSEGDIGELIGGPQSCAGLPQWRVHWSGDGGIAWSAGAGLRKTPCSDRDRDGCLPPPCGEDCNDTVAAVGCRGEACSDGRDNDCDGAADCRDTDCGRDDDLDGCARVPCGKDCDDGEPSVGCRKETCGDGADNDCNGAADCEDGACGRDADRDGCLAPPCGNDCNDTVEAVGCRDELCKDGRDNDCDGATDCRDTSCGRDDDLDGCVRVPCGKDCDDQDPLVGCATELCDDGRDNDCNGAADCADGACDGAPCDGGVFCDGPDSCVGGRCRPVGADPCPGPDGDANCAESCNEIAANCTAPDPDGAPCDLGLAGSVMDACAGGMCMPGPPPNDHCSTGTVVTATPFSAEADTLQGGQGLTDPVPTCSAKLTGGSTVWYRLTPARAGVVVANTFFSGYDTALVAYTGTCANPAVVNLVEVSCSSDAGSGLQSQIVFDVTPGTTYHLMITGEANVAPLPAGILRLSLQLLDEFSDCCAAHDTAGCDTVACQSCVCGEAGGEPGCCAAVWDEACVQAASDAAACSSTCACGFCGDGALAFGEACDDGNSVAGDGCEPDCSPTPGATTTVTTTIPVTPTTDGSVATTTTTVPAGASVAACSPGPCYTHPIPARQLSIRPLATQPDGAALVFLSRARYELPAGAHAPTEDGATLTVRDSGGRRVQFNLPATSWHSLGRRGARGFVYSDKRHRHGPCTKVVLKAGRMIKAACAGPDVALTPPLTEPVDVVLQTGTASSSSSYCARFGAATTRNGGGSYVATNAPPPNGCPLAAP
jgi:hypothetical protein